MDAPRLAQNIMVTKVITLAPHQHVLHGIARLLRNNISGAPVADKDGRYRGVFSEKCCLRILMATGKLVDQQTRRQQPIAKQFMTSRLVTLSPKTDVFDAVGLLLKHRISGAPVVSGTGEYLGVFSEKGSMKALIEAAYEQLPGSQVAAFMDTDTHRVIDPQLSLTEVTQMFIDTHYRRLPVIRDGQLVGQISRRDVLKAQHHLSRYLTNPDQALAEVEDEPSAASEPGDSQDVTSEGFVVQRYMDTAARCTTGETDLLSLAQIFFETPYRRLPVLHKERVVGQVSRRDVLKATNDMLAIAPKAERNLLYLSSLVDRSDAPLD